MITLVIIWSGVMAVLTILYVIFCLKDERAVLIIPLLGLWGIFFIMGMVLKVSNGVSFVHPDNVFKTKNSTIIVVENKTLTDNTIEIYNSSNLCVRKICYTNFFGKQLGNIDYKIIVGTNTVEK